MGAMKRCNQTKAAQKAQVTPQQMTHYLAGRRNASAPIADRLFSARSGGAPGSSGHGCAYKWPSIRASAYTAVTQAYFRLALAVNGYGYGLARG